MSIKTYLTESTPNTLQYMFENLLILLKEYECLLYF